MWKEKKEVLEPDERFENLVRYDPVTCAMHLATIETMYDDMAHYCLPDSVPTENWPKGGASFTAPLPTVVLTTIAWCSV
jgi:hypothetical protein